MLTRLIEKLKGSTFVTEERIDASRITLSGTIPPVAHWREEPYIIVVDALRTTTSRGAWWVKPAYSYRYRVLPITRHSVPVGTRCRTILLTEPVDYYFTTAAQTPFEAQTEFVNYVISMREKKRIAA